MDWQATAQVSIPSGNSVKTELHVLHNGVLFVNDLDVDGT